MEETLLCRRESFVDGKWKRTDTIHIRGLGTTDGHEVKWMDDTVTYCYPAPPVATPPPSDRVYGRSKWWQFWK